MYMNLWENLVSNNITGEKYTLAPHKQTNVWCDVNKSLNIGAGKSCDCVTFIRGFPLAVTLRICPAGEKAEEQEVSPQILKEILNL